MTRQSPDEVDPNLTCDACEPNGSDVERSVLGQVGIVIVGRNEGERLRRCLSALPETAAGIVYVDSGSTDGSVDLARSHGVDVLPLCPSRPFTAARGRNEGFRYLCDRAPEIQVVQFVDADCQLAPNWLLIAANMLLHSTNVAAVAGRLRESQREASVYNMLCDTEWNTPIGPALHFGGNFMIRKEAFDQTGGFDPTIIAAEDSEFCVRLRARGWQLLRLDEEMGWHDAAITRFSQWWKRAVRTGHAFAEGVALHGHTAERHFVRESVSTWIWGCIVPGLAIALSYWTSGWSLLMLSLLVLLVYRIQRGARHRLPVAKERWIFAFFTGLAKIPQCWGQIIYLVRRLRGKPRQLIEYKGVGS